MALMQPTASTLLTANDHSLMHRAIAIHDDSPVQSLIVDAVGDIALGGALTVGGTLDMGTNAISNVTTLGMTDVLTITDGDPADPYVSLAILSGDTGKFTGLGVGTTSVHQYFVVAGGTDDFLPGATQFDAILAYTNATDFHIGRLGTRIDATFDGSGDLDIFGALTLFDGADVGDGANGKKLIINRKAAEGDCSISLYIDQYRRAIIDSSVTVNFLPSGQVDLTLGIGSTSGGNPFFRHAGYLTAVTDERYVSWRVSDITDNFELTREDANILGFDIQMPLVVDSVTDGTYTSDGSGNFSGVGTLGCGAITSTGAIEGTSLTDGTATLSSGSLTSVKLGTLTDNGFVKTSGGDGTLSVDTEVYAPDDQTFYIGTTQVAINRASGTLNLAGIGTIGCGAITGSAGATFVGDVGIGTDNPITNLQVNGDGDAYISITEDGDAKSWISILGGLTGVIGPTIFWDSAEDFQYGTATGLQGAGYSEKMRITSTGKVGIGTDSPRSLFEISGNDAQTTIGNSSGALSITNTNGGAGSTADLVFAGQEDKISAGISYIHRDGANYSRGDIVFGIRPVSATANLTEAMRVQYNGLIGMGVSAPASKLDIDAGATANILRLDNNSYGSGSANYRYTLFSNATNTMSFYGAGTNGVVTSIFLAGTGGHNISATGSITGKSLITTGNIGIAADTNLIQMAANALTVNGSITASGDMLISGQDLNAGQTAGAAGIALNISCGTDDTAVEGAGGNGAAVYISMGGDAENTDGEAGGGGSVYISGGGSGYAAGGSGGTIYLAVGVDGESDGTVNVGSADSNDAILNVYGTINDLTEGWLEEDGSALDTIKGIKTKEDGHIDHSTLGKAKTIIKTKDGDIKGRNIGMMLTMLTKANQELLARIEELENEK